MKKKNHSNLSMSSKIYHTIINEFLTVPFCCMDFRSHGNHNSIRVVLSRFEQKGIIRRLLPGVYDMPRYSEVMGKCPYPSANKIAEVLARKNSWLIVPGPATSLNLLGLSTQVPCIYSFSSTGISKTYTYRKACIEFKHCNLLQKTRLVGWAGIALQAMKELGRELCDMPTLSHIFKKLDSKSISDFYQVVDILPDWMQKKIIQMKMRNIYE